MRLFVSFSSLYILIIGLMSSKIEAQTVVPYGKWVSPISAATVADQSSLPTEVATDGGNIYWVEVRPDEGGRNAIVVSEGNGVANVLPASFSARNMVQEYGGGNLLVSDGTVYFPNFQDQRLYRQDAEKAPVAITPVGDMRYADCRHNTRLGRLYCVQEDHTKLHDVKNTLVTMADDGAGPITTLFAESDFVAAPRIDASGKKIAWISWNHPNMPWNKTVLWTALISGKEGLERQKVVVSGASVVEPQWGPDGWLYFISDKTGWWNIYRYDGKKVKTVLMEDADFSEPAWFFDLSHYAIMDKNTIVAAATSDAMTYLVRINVKSGKAETIKAPFVDIQSLRRLDKDHVVFIGATKDREAHLVTLDIQSGKYAPVKPAGKTGIDTAYISEAQAITFPTTNGDVAHAFYYPPTNPAYKAPAGTAPPLIVSAHGGPTASSTASFSSAVQYWTSRGFAYMAINYRGSSGFGRAYREKLDGMWGVVDVADVVNGAKYAVAQGLADPKKLIIRGGSAGGYDTLAALAFYDVFATGASYYGVSDLAALAKDTHKFESHYLDSLVGPYPADAKLYAERSPIEHLDGFNEPLILFQGLDDKVVPPQQSAKIVAALKKKGLPVEYYTYEGEGHGFVQRDHIVSSLEAELAFYQRILERVQPSYEIGTLRIGVQAEAYTEIGFFSPYRIINRP